MISREEIKSELMKIAQNHNIQSESIDLITDLAAYTIFHNQIEVLNAVQESSLVTAKLLNSKIKACMEVMYSVYRGKSARVRLSFENKTLIKFSKFDKVYESNSFNLYAQDAVEFGPSNIKSDGSVDPFTIELIFCKPKKKYIYEETINQNVKYYLDLIIDRSYLKNLSEDIKVTIDDIEYPTTRNFYDHINTPIPDEKEFDKNKAVDSITNPLDKLFILTIPDYGIRIFKKGYKTEDGKEFGYFKPNQKIKVECLEYFTEVDLIQNELKKINIKGTALYPFNGYKIDEVSGKLTKEPLVEGDEGIELIGEVPRESEEALLYNANLSTRIRGQILSNSDVNALFSEFFRESILSSTNWYDAELNKENGGTLFLYYVPRKVDTDIDNLEINGSKQVDIFINRHKSYFITQTIEPIKSLLCSVYVRLSIYINGTDELNKEIQAVFNQYINKLNPLRKIEDFEWESTDDDQFSVIYGDSLINEHLIKAEITRIPTVSYVEDYKYYEFRIDENKNKRILHTKESDLKFSPKVPIFIRKLIEIDKVTGEPVYKIIPVYYNFNFTVIYKNAYAISS